MLCRLKLFVVFVVQFHVRSSVLFRSPFRYQSWSERTTLCLKTSEKEIIREVWDILFLLGRDSHFCCIFSLSLKVISLFSIFFLSLLLQLLDFVSVPLLFTEFVRLVMWVVSIPLTVVWLFQLTFDELIFFHFLLFFFSCYRYCFVIL